MPDTYKGYYEMKKMFNMFAVAMMLCGFVACGSSSKEEKKDSIDTDNKNEMVNTQQELNASQENATHENTTERGEVESGSEGFGRCAASGCYCKAFSGRGQTCRNCGHAYSKHY